MTPTQPSWASALNLKLMGWWARDPEMDLGIVLPGGRGDKVLDICVILLVNFCILFSNDELA